MAFYKSKYTGAEIDQRLAQGTYDDALMRGFDGTKEDFDILLAKLKKTSDLAFGSQQYEDDRLETINKTVVDAINELHTELQSKPDRGELEEESNLLDSKITTVNNNLVESINTINKNVNDSLTIVNQAIQQNAETIVAEIEQRKEADTKLDSKITQEISDRQTADDQLSERIETVENAGYATKEELNNYALKSELPKQYIVEEGDTLQAGDEQHEFNIKSSGRVTVNSANEVVTYTPYPGEEGRKMLVLANNDSLTGTKTDGTGAPLAFMSKWDKIEIGNSTTSLNLNSLNGEITINDDKIVATTDQIQAPYEINLTNLLSAEDSESISTAIGGIDNLNATVQDNRIIVGTISNGSVSVSIRILGNVTTLYYLLDSVLGLTLNEIAITNTSGTLSKSITTHSVLTENMVINSLNSDETTLPLSAAQGKVLATDKQDKTDNALDTEDKTVVGAINEILPKATGVGKVDPNSNGTGEIFNSYVPDSNRFDDVDINVASGSYSHAEGSRTKAIGRCSHAEGNNTEASESCSHAEGNTTEATGSCSHAEGNWTKALGASSHAEGNWTVAQNSDEHAEGSYNVSNTGDTENLQTRHSVGIGTSNIDTKNAHEIMANGDHYIYGLGEYDGTNPSNAQTLQEVISSKQATITAGTGLEFEGTTLNVTLDTTVFKVVSALPDSPAQGDENKIHLVPAESTGANNAYTEYIWVNSDWEILGEYTSEVDLTPYLKIETAEATYATKNKLQEVQNSVDGKQDTLVSGQNIKSINGESLLGEGDIQIKYPVIFMNNPPQEGYGDIVKVGTLFVSDDGTVGVIHLVSFSATGANFKVMYHNGNSSDPGRFYTKEYKLEDEFDKPNVINELQDVYPLVYFPNQHIITASNFADLLNSDKILPGDLIRINAAVIGDKVYQILSVEKEPQRLTCLDIDGEYDEDTNKGIYNFRIIRIGYQISGSNTTFDYVDSPISDLQNLSLKTTSKLVGEAINELKSSVDDHTSKLPVYTVVPTLTNNYTIPVNNTTQEKVYQIAIGSTVYGVYGQTGIIWQNGIDPVVEANCTIVVSVINNLAVWGKFKNE